MQYSVSQSRCDCYCFISNLLNKNYNYLNMKANGPKAYYEYVISVILMAKKSWNDFCDVISALLIVIFECRRGSQKGPRS